MTILAGVMGWPVEHSRSPRLHTYWLKHYGLAGEYRRLPVPPEGLAEALATLAERGFAGVNLTVPHKEAALALVDQVSDEARAIGAINTIFVKAGGKLHATNTDAFGFITNLKAGAPTCDLTTAVVVGAGGAARAVCFALKAAGCKDLRITNRTVAKAEALARDFGASVVPWPDRAAGLENCTLLVNTSTLGMTGQPALELDLTPLPATAVVNDIVYVPLETPLLRAARARGLATVDGLGMLLYQAQAGFEGWFGLKPEVTPALRAHVLSGAGPE